MRSARTLALAIAWNTLALACAAQNAPPAPAQAAPISSSGTITGTVYCADTDLPARLAVVYLVDGAEHGYAVGDTTMTDLDGRFVFNHVQEGDYYAAASLPGYENLMSVLTKSYLDTLPADDRKKLLAVMPSVTATANQPAQLSIRLERGAEIDGTATYDDGSPAIDLPVRIAMKSEGDEGGVGQATAQPMIYSGAGTARTDDRGRFRILGVLPGEYLVSVSLPVRWSMNADAKASAAVMESSIGSMEVYVGGGQRAAKAETIKVTMGGASKDADITIPLSRLHTIRGQVLLKSTNEAPAAATVRLLYADTREPARAVVAPNGEFEFHYVPEDSFILRATARQESQAGSDSGSGPPMGRYSFNVQPGDGSREGSAEIPLTVTSDMDGVSISVPDPQPSQSAPSNGAGPTNP